MASTDVLSGVSSKRCSLELKNPLNPLNVSAIHQLQVPNDSNPATFPKPPFIPGIDRILFLPRHLTSFL